MKKWISALMFLGLVFPVASKAMLMGFSSDNGLWDQTGKQLYTCFNDSPSTCLGLDNQIYYKSDLVNGITTKPVISAPVTELTQTSFPIIDPVNNQPIINPVNTPTVAGDIKSNMLPPLTDSEIQTLLYNVSYNHNMFWPITFTTNNYPVFCYRPSGGNLSLYTPDQIALLNKLVVTLDGAAIDCSIKFYPDTLPLGTDHVFQLIYKEDGRENTVIKNLPFTTIN